MSDQTAVATTNAKKPSLRAQLAHHADKLAVFGVSPDAFIEAAMMATVKNKDLLACSTESILLALRQCAQTGLDIGRTAHLVPFGTVATFVPDYKGLIELATSTGKVVSVRVRCVYEGEEFFYGETMAGPDLRHVPKMKGNGGTIVGAYAIADLRFGRYKVEFMNVDEIEAIRKKSKSWAKGDLPDWYARKTVVRRLCKTLPSNAKLQQALKFDDAEGEEVVQELPPLEAPKRPHGGASIGAVVTADPYGHGDAMPTDAEVAARLAVHAPTDDDDIDELPGSLPMTGRAA
jgi:phage RecT family recombinase